MRPCLQPSLFVLLALDWLLLPLLPRQCWADLCLRTLSVALSRPVIQAFSCCAFRYRYIMKSEQDEYRVEAIMWESIEVPDNQGACQSTSLSIHHALTLVLDVAFSCVLLAVCRHD